MRKKMIVGLLLSAIISVNSTLSASAAWIEDNKGWWYSKANEYGYSVGWENLDNNWYYFGQNGWMQTGWIKDGNTWYYLSSNGSMTQNRWIGNYYVGVNGAMVTNQWVDGFYTGSDGCWIPGYSQSGQGNWISDQVGWWYAYNSGGYPANKWEQIGNQWYYFLSNGYMAENQWIGNYYTGSTGAMAVNQWIGNYYVDEQGKYCANQQGTLKNLLENALLPVGNTVYVWDGGWDAGDAARIGVNPNWKNFFDAQNGSYDYNQTRFWHGYGLDCSGYLSWVLYNTAYTNSGNESFIEYARDVTQRYSDRGFGSFTEKGQVNDYRPGDILSSSGHTWMVLGVCSDKSVVLFHSSPQGVQINGTVTPSQNANSEAAALASAYMNQYFPQWTAKFPVQTRGLSYLNGYSRFRWNLSSSGLMNDPDGYAGLSANQILQKLFNE